MYNLWICFRYLGYVCPNINCIIIRGTRGICGSYIRRINLWALQFGDQALGSRVGGPNRATKTWYDLRLDSVNWEKIDTRMSYICVTLQWNRNWKIRARNNNSKLKKTVLLLQLVLLLEKCLREKTSLWIQKWYKSITPYS